MPRNMSMILISTLKLYVQECKRDNKHRPAIVASQETEIKRRSIREHQIELRTVNGRATKITDDDNRTHSQ